MLITVSLFMSCQSPSEKAAAYNDIIISKQETIINAFDSLEFSFRQYKKDKMENNHSILKGEIAKGLLALDAIQGFQKDESLLNGTKDLFSTYNEIVDHDYKRIMNLLLIPDSSFTTDDQQQLFDIQTKIKNDIDTAHDDFLKIQATFGKNHNIIFDEEE